MSEIGKININFQVLKTYDPKTLLIADTSDWKHIINKTSIIEVTLPGSKIPKKLFWEKNKLNIFNSSTFGITPKACNQSELVDLPDGIYTIKVLGSPNKFNKTRNFLKTDRLQLEVDKLYISLGLDFDEDKQELRNEICDIDLMLKAAEASMRQGDISKTSLYFNQSKKLLEDFIKCNNCNQYV